KLLEKYVGNEGLNFHNEIMIGQGDIISAEPAMRIRKMADLIMNDEAMIQNLMKGDVSAIHKNSELKIQYEDYLKKFGDRCLQELKLESLTLHDDPILLLQAIAHMARRPKNATEINNSKSLKISGFKLLENSPVKRWILFRIIFWAKARVRDRENLRFERTRLFGRVRNLFLEMGKRLNALKQIENVRDIFFLEVEEVIGFIEGSATIYDFPGLIKIRKKQNEEFNNQAPPPNRFETYGPAGYGFKTQSYQAEIASSNLNNENAENSIKGMGCCQGIVKAMVRVIHNPKEAELKPNEIMVARFTDPGWITLFANASGILVERGSLLSHSAIVAREMGIPAIVGISGVMEWLKTGDWVEMNGSTGIVKKIKEEIKGFEKNDSN
ncbi:MAG: PEP-utilizing enzyme, partial [Gammaproteobacteria bacterium]